MYVIVQTGGTQVRMSPEETVKVPRLEGEPGARITFETVLMCRDGDTLFLGKPFVEGATVQASILSQERGPKIRASKFKRRKKYRRRWGHRQDYTVLKIEELALPESLQ